MNGGQSRTTTRRGILVSLIAVSGCLNPSRAENEVTNTPHQTTQHERTGTTPYSPETTTEETAEQSSEQALMQIANRKDRAQDFEISISSGSDIVFDETVTMAPEDFELVEPGITGSGTYEASVSVTGYGTELHSWELEGTNSALEVELNRTGLHVGSTHSDPTTAS